MGATPAGTGQYTSVRRGADFNAYGTCIGYSAWGTSLKWPKAGENLTVATIAATASHRTGRSSGSADESRPTRRSGRWNARYPLDRRATLDDPLPTFATGTTPSTFPNAGIDRGQPTREVTSWHLPQTNGNPAGRMPADPQPPEPMPADPMPPEPMPPEPMPPDPQPPELMPTRPMPANVAALRTAVRRRRSALAESTPRNWDQAESPTPNRFPKRDRPPD